jgi:rubrerythrin
MIIFYRFILLFSLVMVSAYCTTPKSKKSVEDLKTAFNQESISAEKYGRFAQKAAEEGFDTISQLFLAAEKSELIHASTFVKVIEKYGESVGNAEIGSFEVKSTAENLQTAINGGNYQVQTMYPKFIRDAEFEKVPDAAKSFTWAQDSEKKHLKYFRLSTAAIVKENETNLPYSWLVCPTCGNIYSAADVKDKCDFCLNKYENFVGYQPKPEGE